MITRYSNAVKVDEPTYESAETALARIKNCESRSLIEMVRLCTDKTKRNEIKLKLPSISWSGTFSRRSNESLIKHSGIICLDFDHIEKPLELKQKLTALKYCYACWVSPGGKGIKMLVKVASDNHIGHFYALQADHPTIDKSGKDVSRLCFESADPDIFINPSPEIYNKIITKEIERVVVTNQATLEGRDSYEVIKKWMIKKGDSFSEGSRNVFIMNLATACLRVGVTKEDARMLIYADFIHTSDFKVEEFDKVIEGVYKRYANNFGNAKIQGEKITYENKELTKEDFINDEPAKDLIRCNDVYEELKTNYVDGIKLADTTYFPLIDKHFKWLRGQLNVLNGYGNYGKSTFLNQLMLIRSIMAGNKWAIFSPEQSPPVFFYHDLIQMYVGKSLMEGSKNRMTLAEMENAKEFINEHFFLIDPVKPPSPDYMVERFFEMTVKHNVDGVVVDPWNQLGHERDDAHDIYLEKNLPKFKTFGKNNNMYVTIIAHPKNISNGETNPRPTAFNLSGGMMWNNKVDNIICYHRPNHHSDKNDPTCLFASDKIRMQQIVGIPGEVEMVYDRSTFRFYVGGYNPFVAIKNEQNNEDEPF